MAVEKTFLLIFIVVIFLRCLIPLPQVCVFSHCFERVIIACIVCLFVCF